MASAEERGQLGQVCLDGNLMAWFFICNFS